MQNKHFIVPILFFTTLIVFSSLSYAAHPLITDDTGTQGKGKFQFEIIGEYGYDSEDGVRTDSVQIPTTPVLSYGITDNIDAVFGISYLYQREGEGGTSTDEDGISDTSVEFKWRLYEYEKGGLSFALKPGITFPTGDDERGLGAGRITYGMFLITTEEIEPFAFHLNLGYKKNENKLDERNDIWHASLGGEVEVIKDLKIVGNIGIERNPDKTSHQNPAFILGGVVYSVTEDFDVDVGFKGGLNKSETDSSVLAGITVRF